MNEYIPNFVQSLKTSVRIIYFHAGFRTLHKIWDILGSTFFLVIKMKLSNSVTMSFKLQNP
jgi:hypothetical protein